MLKKLENGCCITAVMPPGSRRVTVTYSGNRCDVEDAFRMLCYELISTGAMSESSLLSSVLTVAHTMLQVNKHS